MQLERIRWQRNGNPLGTMLEGFVGTRQAFVLRDDRSQERGSWKLLFLWSESPELRSIGVMSEEQAKQVAENMLEHWLHETGLVEEPGPKPFDIELLDAVEGALMEGNGNTTHDAPLVLLAVLSPIQRLVTAAAWRGPRDETTSSTDELNGLVEKITDTIEKIHGAVE